MNDKDKIIVQDSAYAIADAIAGKIPGLDVAWGLSKALLEAGLKLRQQKALEWVEMVRDNPAIFTEEILKDENFQDAFVLSLENYIKMRSSEKRKIAQQIFIGFTNSADKGQFKLEKLQTALDNISIDGIKYLFFLTQTIIPMLETDIEAEARRLANETNDYNWYVTSLHRSHTVSEYLEKWIRDEADPNSNIALAKHIGKTHDEMWDKKSELEDIASEHFSEYVSLGVFRVIAESTGGGLGGSGTKTSYTLTEFGKEFLKFIPSEQL